MARKQHHWKVELQSRSGQTQEVTFSSYWSPETDPDTVGRAAAIQFGREAKTEYVALKTTNID